MELAFVLAERQNSFFVEIVDALRDELDQLGVESSTHRGPLPALRDGLMYVLVPPHEWWALQGHMTPPTAAQLKRTVFICAEQPGTSFFSDDVALAPLAGGVLDINRGSVREFARQGVKGVRHCPLGWTRTWSHVGAEDLKGDRARAGRDIDVLHLGIYSERRGNVLATGADQLARWRSRLILGDHDRPNSSVQSNYTMEAEKWDTLVRTRVLLNVHVAERPYFEWLRVVQAIANGAVVVSDLSLGIEPLEPPRHLLMGRPEALGLLASGLLGDEGERARMAHEAFSFLKSELPFASSATTLAETAERALSKARRTRTRARLPDLTFQAPHGQPPGPDVVADKPSASIRDRARTSGPRAPAKIVATSPVVAGATRVSVIVPAGEGAQTAFNTLSDGSLRELEVIVFGSQQAADAPELSAQLAVTRIEVPPDAAPGQARNSAIDRARAPFVCLLTGGTGFYKHGLLRLVKLLENRPEADFAFGMTATTAENGSRELAGFYPWRPDRPGAGNFIDVGTLWRVDALRAVGGFSDGPLDDPWRDSELWQRICARGIVSVHLSQIVAFAG